jgi:hypothetical protein
MVLSLDNPLAAIVPFGPTIKIGGQLFERVNATNDV